MKVVRNKDITQEEAKELSFQDISELINSDPVTCMRHFDHKFRALLNGIMKPQNGMFHPYKLEDYFSRMEFQMRGSPHSHGLYWIKDAPVYVDSDPQSITECIEFIDKFITCERSEQGKMEKLIGYQIHKHAQTCKKKNKQGITCRFGFPKPRETMILKPLDEDFSLEQIRAAKESHKMIEEKLNEWGRGFKEDIEYDSFLESIGIVHEDYITAIRSSIKRATVFLKRSTNSCFVNGYNRQLLEAWEANIDVQFVLDTYGCAKYCVGYILKSDGGVSRLMQEAARDIRHGNTSIQEQLKRFANVLINGSEISAQEATAFLLGIPNTMCSRSDVFINTAPPDQRIRILKSKEELDELEDSCVDVTREGLLEHYVQRPTVLENTCLADIASMYEFVRRKQNSQKRKKRNSKNGMQSNSVRRILVR